MALLTLANTLILLAILFRAQRPSFASILFIILVITLTLSAPSCNHTPPVSV